MNINMETPVFFDPIYKDYIWGGKNLRNILNRNIAGDVAESWEVSAYKTDSTPILSGRFEGKTLIQAFEECKEVFTKNDIFPVLIKFIDASDKLSIQVHPNDEYAKKYENDNGKNEVWYIMDAKEDAKIIYGLNQKKVQNKSNDEIVANMKEYLNYVSVKKGDFIQIPAGTVHAILDGIILCEVQQSSNVTYRIYDWDRLGKDGKPRQLHIEKAKDVISTAKTPEIQNYGSATDSKQIYKNDSFEIELVVVNSNYKTENNLDYSEIYIVIEGEGNLKYSDENKKISRGTVFMKPINCISTLIEGQLKILKVNI